MHQITFQSPFYFGDVVDYAAPHAKGRGRVADIAIGSDRTVYYIIEPDDGSNWEGGIRPHEMQLVQAANSKQGSGGTA